MGKSKHIQMIFYNNPDYYPPTINSISLLAKSDYSISLLCRNNIPPSMTPSSLEYPANVDIIRIRSIFKLTILNYLYFVWTSVRLCKRNSRVIIAYDIHALLPARILAKLYNCPLFYHCHDYVEDDRPNKGLSLKVLKIIERAFAKTSDVVIVPDQERASIMVEQLSLKEFPTIVANASLNTFPKTLNRLKEALDERKCFFEKIVFRPGYIGEGHCLEVTLHSISLWNSKNWGFVIMGPGDSAYKQSLLRLAIDLGVEDRFVILPPVSYVEISSYIIGSNLGHGLYEPIHINNKFITTASSKVMEYIAAGIPLLLTNTIGNHKIIDKYQNGIIADYDDPQSIATAINTVFDNPEIARKLSANSSLAFYNEFNYEIQFRPVLERLEKLTQ